VPTQQQLLDALDLSASYTKRSVGAVLQADKATGEIIDDPDLKISGQTMDDYPLHTSEDLSEVSHTWELQDSAWGDLCPACAGEYEHRGRHS
jgi:hypothetical protein